MRTRIALIMAVTAISIAPVAEAQTSSDPLFQRWVGTHLGRPLFLDFHGDTMLVVNDVHVMDFWYGPDSVIAYNADTSFAIRYRFSYDKMLIETSEGRTVTMSLQPIQARPVFGGRGWDWGTWAARTGDDRIWLELTRIGSRARWRKNFGPWTEGTWRRTGRTFEFTWNGGEEPEPPGATADVDSSLIWIGQFDAEGHQFIFDETEPGSGLAIFRRVFRRN